MHKLLSVLSCLCLVGMTSCDKKRVYDHYQSLPDAQWQKDSTLSFTFTARDTVETYNLFINLRNNSEYKYSNLFLVTKMNFPHGKVVSDTLEYVMATPSGEWLGTGFGDIKENKLWFKENIRFSEEGEYQINIQQSMRSSGDVQGIEILEGITEVGFRVENTVN